MFQKHYKSYTTGVNPSSITLTKNGRIAYVANCNNFQIKGEDTVTVLHIGNHSSSSSSLSTTSGSARNITIRHPSFLEPYRIGLDETRGFGYICNSGGKTLTVLRLSDHTVVDTISGFDGPGGIVIDCFNGIAYVTNYGAAGGLESGNGKTVSVVDLCARVILTSFEVALAPCAIKILPCNQILAVLSYVDGCLGTGVLALYRLGTLECIGSTCGLFGPFDFTIAPCGQLAYVTNFGSNDFAPFGRTVVAVDLLCKDDNRAQLKIVDEIEVGIQPSGVALDHHTIGNTSRLFVSNYNALYAKPKFQCLTFGQGTIEVIQTRCLCLCAHHDDGKEETKQFKCYDSNCGRRTTKKDKTNKPKPKDKNNNKNDNGLITTYPHGDAGGDGRVFRSKIGTIPVPPTPSLLHLSTTFKTDKASLFVVSYEGNIVTEIDVS